MRLPETVCLSHPNFRTCIQTEHAILIAYRQLAQRFYEMHPAKYLSPDEDKEVFRERQYSSQMTTSNNEEDMNDGAIQKRSSRSQGQSEQQHGKMQNPYSRVSQHLVENIKH